MRKTIVGGALVLLMLPAGSGLAESLEKPLSMPFRVVLDTTGSSPVRVFDQTDHLTPNLPVPFRGQLACSSLPAVCAPGVSRLSWQGEVLWSVSMDGTPGKVRIQWILSEINGKESRFSQAFSEGAPGTVHSLSWASRLSGRLATRPP